MSKIKYHIPAHKVGALSGVKLETMADLKALENIGVAFDADAIAGIQSLIHSGKLRSMLANDSAILGNLTSPSIGTPLQFLQTFMPGFVEVITQARNIDNIIGMTTIGNWHDEQIAQGITEVSGRAARYSDFNSTPITGFNVNFEYATVVRFEDGIHVTKLVEARAGEMNYNASDMLRRAAALALEICRNQIGFYGLNNGLGRTYGFLNAPDMPAYTTAPVGAAGDTMWTTKTTLEIINDFIAPLSMLRVQSGDLIDPKSTAITCALPTSRVDMLTKPTELGFSVKQWLQENYPSIRLVSAPELQNANGGENVMYLFADKMPGGGTDDGNTFAQMVPTKFMTLGVSPSTKGYEEAYTNASAGVMCKRPFLVVRVSGI